MKPGQMLPSTDAHMGREPSDETREEMSRLYGSKWSPCPCGRKFVLTYRRGDATTGASNGPDADRLTYHDNPLGIACEHGGKLLSEVAL